jgi:hypothetical protein
MLASLQEKMRKNSLKRERMSLTMKQMQAMIVGGRGKLGGGGGYRVLVCVSECECECGCGCEFYRPLAIAILDTQLLDCQLE